MAVFEHLEKDLAADVVGIVAREHELPAAERAVELHLQKVLFQEAVAQFGKGFKQISHALKVNLHHFQLAPFLEQVLREHAHAGTHFENGQTGRGIYRVGDGLRCGEVFKKVLSEKFFRAYRLHLI